MSKSIEDQIREYWPSQQQRARPHVLAVWHTPGNRHEGTLHSDIYPNFEAAHKAVHEIVAPGTTEEEWEEMGLGEGTPIQQRTEYLKDNEDALGGDLRYKIFPVK